MMVEKGVAYHNIDEKVELGEDCDGCRSNHALKYAKRRSDIIALVLASMVLIQAIWIWNLDGTDKSKPSAYGTEFPDAQFAINDMQKLDFGGWEWDDELQYIKRPVDLSKPQYFGDPRELHDMEDNWDKLLEVQFFALTDQEALDYPDLSPMPGRPDKYMELDVTHKLHCVNHLRKMLYNHYYNYTVHALQMSTAPPGFYLDHMDHCLETLFDGVTCHSDLTPAPVYPFIPGTNNATFSVSKTHTCRNFDHIRQWLYKRASQKPSYTSHGRLYKPPIN